MVCEVLVYLGFCLSSEDAVADAVVGLLLLRNDVLDMVGLEVDDEADDALSGSLTSIARYTEVGT